MNNAQAMAAEQQRRPHEEQADRNLPQLLNSDRSCKNDLAQLEVPQAAVHDSNQQLPAEKQKKEEQKIEEELHIADDNMNHQAFAEIEIFQQEEAKQELRDLVQAVENNDEAIIDRDEEQKEDRQEDAQQSDEENQSSDGDFSENSFDETDLCES